MHRNRCTTATLPLIVFALLLTGAGPAKAAMILTSDGAAEGFTLTTFASGFFQRGDGLGPIGIGFPSTGGVLVSVEGASSSGVYQFATDADGQTTATATLHTYSGNNTVGGIVSVGSTLYMAEANLNQVIQLNNDGSPGSPVALFLNNPVAFATDPTSGHLFVSLYLGGIWNLDPTTGNATQFSTQNVDGIALDPSAHILYGATADATRVIGLDTTTGAQVYDSGFIAGGPDGIALGFGALAGNLFVNTNDGTVVEINLATNAQTVIASGGSRGDLVTVDPLDNSLLLTQTDSVLRLSAPPAVPAPSSMVLLSIGVVSLGVYAARKRLKLAFS